MKERRCCSHLRLRSKGVVVQECYYQMPHIFWQKKLFTWILSFSLCKSTSFFSFFSSLLTDWVCKSSPAGTEVEQKTSLLCSLLNAFSSKLNN